MVGPCQRPSQADHMEGHGKTAATPSKPPSQQRGSRNGAYSIGTQGCRALHGHLPQKQAVRLGRLPPPLLRAGWACCLFWRVCRRLPRLTPCGSLGSFQGEVQDLARQQVIQLGQPGSCSSCSGLRMVMLYFQALLGWLLAAGARAGLLNQLGRAAWAGP